MHGIINGISNINVNGMSILFESADFSEGKKINGSF
jgi:hypothetical protein